MVTPNRSTRSSYLLAALLLAACGAPADGAAEVESVNAIAGPASYEMLLQRALVDESSSPQWRAQVVATAEVLNRHLRADAAAMLRDGIGPNHLMAILGTAAYPSSVVSLPTAAQDVLLVRDLFDPLAALLASALQQPPPPEGGRVPRIGAMVHALVESPYARARAAALRSLGIVVEPGLQAQREVGGRPAVRLNEAAVGRALIARQLSYGDVATILPLDDRNERAWRAILTSVLAGLAPFQVQVWQAPASPLTSARPVPAEPTYVPTRRPAY